jgi:hypothetical protein
MRGSSIGLALALAGSVHGAGGNMTTIRAELDPRLKVKRVSEQRLNYRDGADPAEDRPAHVRAASGLGWLDGRLAIVQDDANFVGLWSPGGEVAALPLPRGPGGKRQFDPKRGNKKQKLDLEAAATTRVDGKDVVVMFGSGSAEAREVIVRVTAPGAVRVDRAPELYAALRARREFSGSEMNIEGAAILPDGRFKLFQRGNGAKRDGLEPVNATIELKWPELEAWLDRKPGAQLPELGAVVSYDLGKVNGVRLTFTDAAPAPGGRVVFLASAEDSPDAIEDGPVVGSAVGVIEPSGKARYALLEGGEPLKLEGVTLDRARRDRAYLVADPDDPDKPGVLLTAELSGPWFDMD